MNKNGIAIVPGSFDPITLGHLNIVKRAAQMYGKVYVAVLINPKKEYMFTMEQRVEIAKAAVENIENVEVISSTGYLWKLALDLGACALVKGIRNGEDRAYELEMAKFNEEHNPNAKTVLLDTDPTLAGVSSTVAREKILKGQSLSDCLPKEAIEQIRKIKEN